MKRSESRTRIVRLRIQIRMVMIAGVLLGGLVSAADFEGRAEKPHAKSGRFLVRVEATESIKAHPRLAWDRNRQQNNRTVTNTFSNGTGQGFGIASGGASAGTFDAPNYAFALSVSPVPKGTQIKLDGAILKDTDGNSYESVDHDEPFRMTVPEFEATHPGCAGAYFRFAEEPKELSHISGHLLLEPAQVHEAKFSGKFLKSNAPVKTKLGMVRLKKYEMSDEGLTIELEIPSSDRAMPARGFRSPAEFHQWRQSQRKMRQSIRVTIIDSEGNIHLPKTESGGGSTSGSSQGFASGGGFATGGSQFGSASGNGRSGRQNRRSASRSQGANSRSQGNRPVTQRTCTFSPLEGSLAIKAIVVSITQPTKGKTQRIPFKVSLLRN